MGTNKPTIQQTDEVRQTLQLGLGLDPNHQHKPAVSVRLRAIDTARDQRFFAGVEVLVREAKLSRDPRVHEVAFGVLALQRKELRERQ